MHPQDLAAHVAQLQAELSRSEGQNKLLASNVQHKDRELSALRQQKAQLERAAAAGPGGAAAAGPQRPSFALGELQRQLESMQRQLAFKEAEVGAAVPAVAAHWGAGAGVRFVSLAGSVVARVSASSPPCMR